MKKLISLLVLMALAVSLAVPAAAAEDASASTMRLESTEGTVTVKNASGLTVKLQSKMRLYDGYTVKTNSASYAYISLDGAKTLKLDASSEASVAKSGKKLEITLVSGSLFFNVSKPLESSESLNIRTSTMVTGVRGTSACVSAPSRNHTEITLLTGRLEVTGRDSRSGEMETMEMAAGERAVVAQEAAGTPQEHMEIQKLSAKERELPGFAAVEVAKDPELQNKISAETALSVPLIIADAEDRLAADEAAAREKEAEVRQRREQERQDKAVDPVFRVNDDDDIYGRDDDDDGGYDDGGSGSGQPTVQEKVVTLTDPTQEELEAALYSNDTAAINLLVTAADLTNPTAAPVLKLTENLAVPQGKALNLLSGTLCNEAQLTVMGTLTIAEGTCLTNTGCFHSDSGGVIYVYGSLVNITDNNIPSTLDDGMFLSGMTSVSSGGEIVNAGSVNSSFIVVYGRLDMNGGTVSNSGNFEISGYDEVHATAYLTDSQFNNNGALTIGGTMTVGSGATLNNGANGDVSVYSTNSLHIAGTMTNAGRLWIGGLVDDAVASGRVAVSGTLELQGATDNGRVVIAGSGSVLEISGILKVSGSSDLTVHPESSFLIRENASYQLFKLEPGPTEQLQTPVGGYYTYTNNNEPSAGGASDYVVFKLEPAGAVPVMTHTVTISGEHVTAAPAMTNTVTEGESLTFTLTPDTGYVVTSVTCGADTLTPTGGSYSVGPVNGDLTVTVTAKSTTEDLTTSNLDDLTAALNDPVVKTINLSTTNGLVVGMAHSNVSDPGFDIPTGKTLNLVSGSFTFANVDISGIVTTGPAATLTVAYSEIDGTTANTLTVKSGGTLTVNGDLIVEDGYLNNYGTLIFSNGSNIRINQSGYYVTNGDGGKMTVSGTLEVGTGTSLGNDGTLTIDSNGTLTVSDGGALNNNGMLTNSGALTIGGTADVSGRFLVGNGSTIDVSGTLTLRAAMEAASGETLTEQQITLEDNAELHVLQALGEPTFSDENVETGSGDPIPYVNHTGAQVIATIVLETPAP